MTTDGFFSVTQSHADPDDVCVRARDRDDLNLLLASLTANGELELGNGPPIRTSFDRDYPYRVIMPAKLWATYLWVYAQQIDYTNFKNAVDARRGRRHHDAFLAVWSALDRLLPTKRTRDAQNRSWWNIRREADDSAFSTRTYGSFTSPNVELERSSSFAWDDLPGLSASGADDPEHDEGCNWEGFTLDETVLFGDMPMSCECEAGARWRADQFAKATDEPAG